MVTELYMSEVTVHRCGSNCTHTDYWTTKESMLSYVQGAATGPSCVRAVAFRIYQTDLERVTLEGMECLFEYDVDGEYEWNVE